MTDKPDIGRNTYKEVLRRGKSRAKLARDALREIIDKSPGPQTTAMLITKVALSLGDIEAIFAELDEIGRTAKSLTNKQGGP